MEGARPARISGSLPLARAIRSHYENLLAALAGDLIVSDQLSVGRPGRRENIPEQ
jgi:hypothetical protein